MSNNEYLMNTRAVGDMSDNINMKAAEYLRIIDETTAIVDELAGHWEGQTYQTFRDGYYSHLRDLEDLNSSLKTLAGDLYDQAERTRSTASKLRSFMR